MEARRSARVTTEFLVAIDGLYRGFVRRTGNISTRGIYFETDHDPGEVGTVHWIHITAVDGSRAVRVMACVARKVTVEAAARGRSMGVAFEFMSESDEAVIALQDFVCYALEQGTTRAAMEPRLGAVAQSSKRSDPSAAVRQLSVRSLTLETSWSVAPGEVVRADIVPPGMARTIRVEGRAKHVTSLFDPVMGRRFLIEVEVQEAADGPVRRRSSMTLRAVTAAEAAAHAAKLSTAPPPPRETPTAKAELTEEALDGALDDLLASLILPSGSDSDRPHHQHLSGELSRVRLAALCSLFGMESMTGVLVLERDAERVSVFVEDGELIDVEPVARGGSARGEIQRLLGWDRGTFTFTMRPLNRPNRIGTRTTALLLDLAREEDEGGRGPR